ncbi:MAG TPA: hypothetical protein VMS40_15650 [Vicinamibacterales bacterium]|nr:hypothetical protein [Vicinamibacterales bacterium]
MAPEINRRRTLDFNSGEAHYGVDNQLAVGLARTRGRRALRWRPTLRVGEHLFVNGRLGRSESVDTSGMVAVLAAATRAGGPARPRTGIPAAFRYTLAVSR